MEAIRVESRKEEQNKKEKQSWMLINCWEEHRNLSRITYILYNNVICIGRQTKRNYERTECLRNKGYRV